MREVQKASCIDDSFAMARMRMLNTVGRISMLTHERRDMIRSRINMPQNIQGMSNATASVVFMTVTKG